MQKRFDAKDWCRYGGFVLLNVAMTACFSYSITQFVGAVRTEGMKMLVLPMTVIALIVFFVMYPILRRVEPGISRFIALYSGFACSLVALGLYLSFFVFNRNTGGVTNPTTNLQNFFFWLILIVGCGHLYGFPALLAIAGVNKVLSRVFFPRIVAVR